MELLIALKPIRLNGDLLQPGEMFKAVDSQPLIDGEYARGLTEQEISEILGAYVAYAEEIFAKRPRPIDQPRRDKKAMLPQKSDGLF